MIKCVIIDDEPLARSIVLEYLQQYPEVTVLQECNDGFEGVKAIMQHQPDLIFLDIQMPKINGIEMLELIEQKPAVIFTTAFDEYAMKAFDNNAIDYLLKPFSKERFDQAFSKWQQHNLQQNNERTQQILDTRTRNADENSRVVVKSHNQIRIIPVHEILYLEAYDDKEFVRVHRSYIIKLDQLTKIEHPDRDSHVALLKTGAKIPLSKTGYGRLKGVLGI